MKQRIIAIVLLIAGAGLGYFIYATQHNSNSSFHFKLGLDLAGGTLLTYRADVSDLPHGDVENAMNSLRDVIERRVNLFGVSEPVVQVERAAVSGGREERLVVELPGVTDVDAAVRQLGQTPVLEFKLLKEETVRSASTTVGTTSLAALYEPTQLTGRFLERASLQFGATGQGSIIQQPIIALDFNEEGAKLFAEITRDNIGQVLAIFLDGVAISQPVIQSEITDGSAIITGVSDPTEAKELVRNLNFGALPVPIELVGAQSIGATLGEEVVQAGIQAGIWGLAIVALFMILWYRLPGVIATLMLALYAILMLTLTKLFGITLTAAGIAGFILSVGMAVDANILIFERMKEELHAGKDLPHAIKEGFARAWFSIRDGNITSLLTASILFYTTTSLVKGFALTMALGVIVSMLTAITITRTFLAAIAPKTLTPTVRFLFGSGLSK
jgi:preprotein translocase subunit SecD